MNKIVFVLVLVALANGSGTMREFLSNVGIGQQCQNNINAYTVTAFTVTPFPPTRGVTVTSVSTGTFSQQEVITGIRIDVLLNNRSFYHETIPQSGTFSPGQQGVFTYTQAVPEIAPNGAYTIQGGLINNQGQQINCWEVSFNLT